ncbi:hypothetical protein [Sphingosinicella sp. YJ22]|uniref:hypothetical protein n=1 Tax=Sphingosinicella sp. YJ22 TaxID=1104780 RepID=UPI0014091476|nr:hypothetical protein [Sphingosinicella sp. YJ22]
MNALYIALGAVFLALAMASFGRARKAATPQAARSAHFSSALMTVAAIAFFVAGALSAWNAG